MLFDVLADCSFGNKIPFGQQPPATSALRNPCTTVGQMQSMSVPSVSQQPSIAYVPYNVPYRTPQYSMRQVRDPYSLPSVQHLRWMMNVTRQHTQAQRNTRLQATAAPVAPQQQAPQQATQQIPQQPNMDDRIQLLTHTLQRVEQATNRDATLLTTLQHDLVQLRQDWQSKQSQLQELCDLVTELRAVSTDVIVLTHQVARAQSKVDNMQRLMQAREAEIKQLIQRLDALQPGKGWWWWAMGGRMAKGDVYIHMCCVF